MKFQKIKLPFKIKRPVLALGPQTKNRVCFARGNFAYLGPLHPDLTHPRDFFAFERSVKYFLKKKPGIIAYDLHPEYQSTKYALNLKPNAYQFIPIQHHHAHIASCMLENGLTRQKVIGVAFDGTGLGNDHRLWGAEFLVCDYKDFKRTAHLKEIPLLGAERAILEPIRIVFAWFFNLGPDLLKKIGLKEQRVLRQMYLSGFNSPLASSMGRLFDAAGSLVLARSKVTREGELALALERIAASYKGEALSYQFKITKDKEGYILDPLLVLKGIIQDLKAGEPKGKIAYRFHLTVARMIQKMCLILGKENKINKVVLSGGVFQNNLLLRLTLDLLYKEVFRVFTHEKVSPNDSGISLGQVAVANFKG
ncbi:MAG: hypothetical protein A3K54_03495 [Omnitrophica WOR_2 bacterium RBG_13_44_8]|nr:MAG: hypothetical protein A3K54_03495 [Omnitrophica WOR_2 bacterium RBG_13_44_8]